MTAQQSNNSTNRPLVSVIMNCLNGEKYLKEAIDSVYTQTYKNWEIIFWDNASTDRSAEIAKSYDERLRYCRGAKTIPLGAARNKALEQVLGEFIAFLDCDDLWMPEKLKKQIPLFEKDEDVGLVFCDTIFFNKKGNQKRVYRKWKPPRGRAFAKLLSNYFLALPSVVIRKKALDSLNERFDERFNMIEEYELFVRLSYKCKIDYVDEPLAKWRMHNLSWTFSRKALVPLEKELMISKFRLIYENFDRQYSNEVSLVKAKIAIDYALLEFENGNHLKARSILKPYLNISPKIRLYYWLTFLPYALYSALYKCYSGIKPL